jgi:hypothetical protein
MSRKTIIFQTPAKAAPAAAGLEPTGDPTGPGLDRWVFQDQAAEPQTAKGAAPFMTIRISAQPDPFEVFKIWFLLPYLVSSYWALWAAQRSLR